MHNITKIKIFRVLLAITWLPSLLLVLPFALLRKKEASGLFFFFDRFVMGGAQRIHLDILDALSGTEKAVFFTRFSANAVFRKEFYEKPRTRCLDVHIACDYLLIRLFTVHYFAFYLNRHRSVAVLGANSTFYYDMLPFLRRKTLRVELLHNFTFGKSGMEFFGLMNCRYLDRRIVYDPFTRENIEKQYREYAVDPVFLERIAYIEPGVSIPAAGPKIFSLPLKVLCAGRGGPQKRIWLVNRIVRQLRTEQCPVTFHFAGTLTDELDPDVKEASTLHGEISDPRDMQALQALSHAALLTSAYEGFPMFIKEAMANGTVPVVTALPGNLDHLHDGENALLIGDIEDEEKVVSSAVTLLTRLAKDRLLWERLSRAAAEYAKTNFSKKTFEEKYRALLTP